MDQMILEPLHLSISIVVLSGLLAWEVANPYFISFFSGAKGLGRRWENAVFNLGLGALNAGITAIVFVGAWSAVTSWANTHHFGLLHWIHARGLLQGIGAIFLLDGWTYAWHWLNHASPFLWRFHRLHHSDREMNVTTATRFHVVEILLSSTLRIPLLALLGVGIQELAAYDLLLFTVVQFQHANIGLTGRMDRLLRCVIITPHMHKVHHSIVRAEADSNYGSLFTWWDRIFHTFRLSTNPRRIVFGVTSMDAPKAEKSAETSEYSLP